MLLLFDSFLFIYFDYERKGRVCERGYEDFLCSKCECKEKGNCYYQKRSNCYFCEKKEIILQVFLLLFTFTPFLFFFFYLPKSTKARDFYSILIPIFCIFFIFFLFLFYFILLFERDWIVCVVNHVFRRMVLPDNVECDEFIVFFHFEWQSLSSNRKWKK